jgi:hypothetical protein
MPHFNDLLTTSKIIERFRRDVLDAMSYNLVFIEHGSLADESIQPYEVYLYAKTDKSTSKDVLYYALLDENRAVKKVTLNGLLDEKYINILAGKIDSDEKSLRSAKKALLTLFSQAGYPVHIPSPLKSFQTKVLHCFLPNLSESASSETIITALKAEATFSPDYLQLRECLIRLFSLNEATHREHADVLTKEALDLSDKRDWLPNNSHLNFVKQDSEYGYFQDCSKEAKALFEKLVIVTRTIAVLIERNNTAADTMAYDYAYKLMAVLVTPTELWTINIDDLFDIVAKRIDKLLAQKSGESSKPFHDALINFKLPKIGDIDDLDGWRIFIKQEGSNALKFFSKAQPIELKIAELSVPHKGCGLIVTHNEISLKNKKETKADLLKKLPEHLNAAYIIVNNKNTHKIFYVNRTSHQCIDLKIRAEHLKKLKEIFPQMQSAETLSEAHLDLMTLVTNHRHQEKQAPQDIKVARHIDRLCTYKREAEHKMFSEICYKYGVLEERFNAGLDFMREHPEKTPDTLPVATITGIQRDHSTEVECSYYVESVRNKSFQFVASNINKIPLRFHANAQYYRLNNKGYDFELGRPVSSEEMEEKTVYLYMERVEIPSKRYFYRKETVATLKYMLKNSQGEVVTRELTETDLEGKYQSILKKVMEATHDNEQIIVSSEATALRRVLAEKDPFPIDERETKKLYYFDKITNKRTELFLTSAQLSDLDEKFFTKEKKETDLSEKALIEIESYTHQSHKTDVDNTQYCWVKLPYSAEYDPRGLVLGDITDCCQSIGAEADQCVKDALTLKNNGLYVLLRQKKPGPVDPFLADRINIDYERFEIVGQSYVVKSSTGNLLLDSVEYLSSVPISVIKETLTRFAEQVLAENTDIKRVVIGDISQEAIKGLFKKTLILEIMEEGLNYGDAREQSCIAERVYTNSEKVAMLKEDEAKKTDKEQEDSELYFEKEMLCYLSHYVMDPNFFVHFQENLKTSPHPWAIQLLLSFNRHPSLDDLKQFYDWLEHDSNFGRSGFASLGIDRIDYQSICRVPFESIALFPWNDIMQYSTLNKIINMVALLNNLNINRRNFPSIDLKLIQQEYLPENYSQIQFFSALILLSKDSPEKAIDKTFKELVESTKNFIKEHDINEPERINALLSDNALACYSVRHSNNANSVVSFRELVAVKGEPETYTPPKKLDSEITEATRQKTISIDSEDSYHWYDFALYKPDPRLEEEESDRRVYATTTSSSLIKALTSEKALICYTLVDKDKKIVITLKDLIPTGYMSSYWIERRIEVMTSYDVMQALKDNVLTVAHVLEHSDYYESYFSNDRTRRPLINALRKNLFSLTDVDKDFLMFSNPEIFKALEEGLFNITDFKENISLHNTKIIHALREKLFSITDFKANPEVFSDLVVIDGLRNKQLDVAGIISKSALADPEKSKQCSRPSSISSDNSHASSVVERLSHSHSGLFYHNDEKIVAEDPKSETPSINNEM